MFFSFLKPKSIRQVQAGHIRAVDFLKGLGKLLAATSNIQKADLYKLFAKITGTEVSEGRWNGLLHDAERTRAYLESKGLTSNFLVINGKIMELKSLEELLEIPSASQRQDTQEVLFVDLLRFVLLQEQHQILSLIMMRAASTASYNIPDLVLANGATPTCMFEESKRPMAKNQQVNFCKVVTLKEDESPPIALGQEEWDAYKVFGRAGSFSLQSKASPIISATALMEIPIVLSLSNRRFNNLLTVPIDSVLVFQFNLHGLRILSSYLSHLSLSWRGQTYLYEAHKNVFWIHSLRLFPLYDDLDKAAARFAQLLSLALSLDKKNLNQVKEDPLPLNLTEMFLKTVFVELSRNQSLTAENLELMFNQAAESSGIKTFVLPSIDEWKSPRELKRQISSSLKSSESGAALIINNQFFSLSALDETMNAFSLFELIVFADTIPLQTGSKPQFESLEEKSDLSDETKDFQITQNHILRQIQNNDRNSASLWFVLALKKRLKHSESLGSLKAIYQQARPAMQLHLKPPVSRLPSPLTFFAILDPLSKTAQPWLPIFRILNTVLNVEIKVVLNPVESLKEYPLSSWHRQVVRAPSVLSLSAKNVPSYDSTFKGLKTNHTLTTELHVPDRWLARASSTAYDLDNLRVSSLNNQLISVTYVLSDLFIEGSALDAAQDEEHINIAGLKLELRETENDQPKKNIANSAYEARDTIVMGNFGYFQLRASPGEFWIHLGKNTQNPSNRLLVDSLDGHPLTNLLPSQKSFMASEHARQVPVIVNSFFGLPSILKVRGLQDTKRKELSLPFGQTLNRISRYLKGLTTVARYSTCTEMVHIFSLASGHMYERLLRIMMVSVRRHTDCPLTFWFIDNFLSPKFKELMPYMAKKYDLSYRYVTYKWPSWLKKQTEKQRQIWAYKILFLDVLFPNDIQRIIYIDADQIVRANIYGLWTLDLKGRPYGFTPFCDTNPATENIRFWKHGYWANHLNGKPYHISALFVVDMEAFRSIGAGDSLRAVYNMLSRDKHSLANLDQDLPNFAQHQIPIYPLPQEWLWCETWCSNATLKQAKTIDLCNNPLTKEPKLSQARRIIQEWNLYDEEIRNLGDPTHLESSDTLQLAPAIDINKSKPIPLEEL